MVGPRETRCREQDGDGKTGSQVELALCVPVYPQIQVKIRVRLASQLAFLVSPRDHTPDRIIPLLLSASSTTTPLTNIRQCRRPIPGIRS